MKLSCFLILLVMIVLVVSAFISATARAGTNAPVLTAQTANTFTMPVVLCTSSPSVPAYNCFSGYAPLPVTTLNSPLIPSIIEARCRAVTESSPAQNTLTSINRNDQGYSILKGPHTA